MPTKKELMDGLRENATYTTSEVKFFINSVSTSNTEQTYSQLKPTSLKRGDIFRNVCPTSGKIRPYVVVTSNVSHTFAIPFTSSEGPLTFIKHESRFLKEGFFTKSLMCFDTEKTLSHFCGVYDNPRHLKKVIMELSTLLNTQTK